MADRSFGPGGPPRYPAAGWHVRAAASALRAKGEVAATAQASNQRAAQAAQAEAGLVSATSRFQAATLAYRSVQATASPAWLVAMGAQRHRAAGADVANARAHWHQCKASQQEAVAQLQTASRQLRVAGEVLDRAEEHREQWTSQQRRLRERKSEE